MKYILSAVFGFIILSLIVITIFTNDSDALELAEQHVNSSELIEKELNAPPPYKIGISKSGVSGNTMYYEIYVSKNNKTLLVKVFLLKKEDIWMVDKLVLL